MRIVHTNSGSRGFTLIETVVASIIGAVVLLGCFSVFAASTRMDRAFNDRFERANDLHITQMAMRRAFLAMQMEENDTARVTTEEDGITETEPEPRDRIILDLDPSAGKDTSGWMPQRLEMVLATPPVAMNLASQSAGWIRMVQQDDSLDFSSPDGSGGAMRSVFEFRRTNTREDVLLRTGLIDSGLYESMTGIDPNKEQLNPATEPPEGWTLWWRPILGYEAESLELGYPPYLDSEGTTDEIRNRLAGAIPIARGIDRARWQLYKGDEMIDLYSGATMIDLPAYAAFEIQTLSGQYATWLFEIDWVIGEDPNDGSGSDSTEDEVNDDGQNNGGGNGDRPTRPGGGFQPPTNNHNFDLNGSDS